MYVSQKNLKISINVSTEYFVDNLWFCYIIHDQDQQSLCIIWSRHWIVEPDYEFHAAQREKPSSVCFWMSCIATDEPGEITSTSQSTGDARLGLIGHGHRNQRRYRFRVSPLKLFTEKATWKSVLIRVVSCNHGTHLLARIYFFILFVQIHWDESINSRPVQLFFQCTLSTKRMWTLVHTYLTCYKIMITILHYAIPYYTILNYTILRYIILYYIIPYYTTLYHILPHYATFGTILTLFNTILTHFWHHFNIILTPF